MLVSILTASVLMFYANFVFYNSSPVDVSQTSALQIQLQQNVPKAVVITSIILYMSSFYFLLTTDEPDSRTHGLVLVIVIGVVALTQYAFVDFHSWILTRPIGGQTDEYLLQYLSAKSVIDPTNPYIVNFTSAIANSVPSYYRTFYPINGTYAITNPFVHNIDYPAFSFLYYVPSAVLNVSGVYQDIAITTLTLGIVWYKSAKEIAWFVPLLFILDYTHIVFISSSITDAGWVAPIILSIVFRKHPIVSSILMGLAVSYKEEAIIFLPFYLIYLYKEQGFEFIKKFGITLVATAAVINIPFLLMNPSAFIRDILIPITASTQIGGVGLSGFTNYPRWVYTALFSSSLFLGSLAYFKWFDKIRIGGLSALPMIALWLNTRSLQDYLVFFPLFSAVVLAMTWKNYSYHVPDETKAVITI